MKAVVILGAQDPSGLDTDEDHQMEPPRLFSEGVEFCQIILIDMVNKNGNYA